VNEERHMSRRGALSFGCLLWGALILLVVVIAWKCIDFYVLGPAAVKRAMNRVDANVTDTLDRALKRQEFRRLWEELRDSPDGLPEMRFPNTAMFSGDTFIVMYEDSLPIPGFPPLRHSFMLRKLIR
jgi:hypothetical protein